MTGPAGADRIELRGLRTTMRLGVPAVERSRPQPVEFDIDLELDLTEVAASDDVAHTADYGAVVDAVVAALDAEPVATLERTAQLVAEVCLAAAASVHAATVTVRKLRPPVAADLATAGVRRRVER